MHNRVLAAAFATVLALPMAMSIHAADDAKAKAPAVAGEKVTFKVAGMT